MKANEFVKKFGWDLAKEIASFTSNVCADPTHFDSDLDIYVHFDDFKGVMDESDVCIADLKRIVESHELVERVISDHNKSFKECQIDIHGLKVFVKKNPKIYPNRLKQAIADVESCQ